MFREIHTTSERLITEFVLFSPKGRGEFSYRRLGGHVSVSKKAAIYAPSGAFYTRVVLLWFSKVQSYSDKFIHVR